MRIICLLTVWTILMIGLAAESYGQTAMIDSVPTITVIGKAEIAVEPDYATITVDFTKIDKDLPTARKLNEDGVTKMLGVTRKYGIAETDVTTNNISVSMKYLSVRDRQKPIYDDDGDEVGTRTFQGYEVSRSVTVKLSKLADFDKLFNDILETGPTEIGRVEFETSKIVELRVRARDAAMKAARDKAVAMAASIGQTIGKALKITEGNATERFVNIGGETSNSIVGPPVRAVRTSLGSFSPGTVRAEVTVTIVFGLN